MTDNKADEILRKLEAILLMLNQLVNKPMTATARLSADDIYALSRRNRS